MNLRWLFGNFADPQYKLTRREQFRLSNQAHLRYVTPKAFLWRTVLIALPWLGLLMLIKPTLAYFGLGMQSKPYMMVLMTLLVLFWPWSAWMYRSLYIRPVRRAMREAGYDLCINCGYELRGLDESITQCPECGEAR